LEYHEKFMMQEEVIDYKEAHQIQKPKDAGRKEIVIFLRSEHLPASEVEETNSKSNEENSEKRASPAPN
jgi:hypothetical protein